MIDRHKDEVLVACLSVPPTRQEIDALSEMLVEPERERARRFAFERDAELFITAHALLRYTLWRATGVSNWQFSTNQFGKPELHPRSGHPRLRFNLAHSAALAVCAICHDHDIGVDLEAIDDDFQIDEVAENYFTAHECAQLNSCPRDARSAAFLRIWTLKEALIKATGRGLSQPLDDFEITLEPLSLSTPVGHAITAEHWHIEQRKLSARHWASIAVRRPPGTGLSVRWRTITAEELASAAKN